MKIAGVADPVLAPGWGEGVGRGRRHAGGATFGGTGVARSGAGSVGRHAAVRPGETARTNRHRRRGRESRTKSPRRLETHRNSGRPVKAGPVRRIRPRGAVTRGRRDAESRAAAVRSGSVVGDSRNRSRTAREWVSRPDQHPNSKGVGTVDQANHPRFPGFFRPAVAAYLARIGRTLTTARIPPRRISPTGARGTTLQFRRRRPFLPARHRFVI